MKDHILIYYVMLAQPLQILAIVFLALIISAILTIVMQDKLELIIEENIPQQTHNSVAVKTQVNE